jgi:hypothetical protein
MTDQQPQQPPKAKKRGAQFCARCRRPRDAEATQYSYCSPCGRARQRERYRGTLTAAGKDYSPRPHTHAIQTTPVIHDANGNVLHGLTPEQARRMFLLQSAGKPGPCECCSQHSNALILQHTTTPTATTTTTAPSNADTAAPATTQTPQTPATTTAPLAVWCSDCTLVARSLTQEQLDRASLLYMHLVRLEATLADVAQNSPK